MSNTIFHGGHFVHTTYTPCPDSVRTGEQVDAFVAKVLQSLPSPPGLQHESPIMGRNKDLTMTISIRWSGPDYAIGTLSVVAIYSRYTALAAARLRAAAEKAQQSA